MDYLDELKFKKLEELVLVFCLVLIISLGALGWMIAEVKELGKEYNTMYIELHKIKEAVK